MYDVVNTTAAHMMPRLGIPVPLWSTVESTGQASRSEAADVAPSLDARFQHLGCTHPQSF